MTLHLTRLRLNTLDRQVIRDLADPYDMHRTLMRAAQQQPDVLTPFLWRQECSGPTEPQIVLIQSEQPLNWNALPAGFAHQIEHRSWDPDAVLISGQQVRFRVTANPTVNRVPLPNPGDEPSNRPARGRRKRLGLRAEGDQLAWMQRQADRLGLIRVSAGVSRAGQICSHRKAHHRITVFTAQFDGVATIAEPEALISGMRRGIGHARMLGLGLVTIAPLRSP